MNVGELMTREIRTCGTTDSLNKAAQLMWENDCGCVPVVDADGKAIAMVTDRDICMAAYTQGKPLAEMSISSAASRGIVAVTAQDSLETAEAAMQKHQIRRVPVVDGAGKPIGILSMNDIARHAQRVGHKRDGLGPDAIARTLAAICQPSVDHAHAAE
jgi:CBS domain-containing protein